MTRELPYFIFAGLVALWILTVAGMVVHPLVWPALLIIVALERGSYWFWLADQPDPGLKLLKGDGK